MRNTVSMSKSLRSFVILAVFATGMILPSVALYQGPNCPLGRNDIFEGKRYLYTYVSGRVFCYMLYKNSTVGIANLQNAVHWCKGLHLDAYPAVPETAEAVQTLTEMTSDSADAYYTGVKADASSTLRDYGNKEVKVPLSISVRALNALVFSNTGPSFGDMNSSKVICQIEAFPFEHIDLPPPYLSFECPEGFKKVQLAYADKCYKIINYPKPLHRCQVNSWCKDTHPNSLPLNARTGEEARLVQEQEVKNLTFAIFTGIHAPCSMDVMRSDDTSKVMYLYTENRIFEQKWATSNFSHAEYLIAIGATNAFEDYPEGGVNQRVMCEIMLPRQPKPSGKCMAEYLHPPGNKQICVSRYVYEPKKALQSGDFHSKPGQHVNDDSEIDDKDYDSGGKDDEPEEEQKPKGEQSEKQSEKQSEEQSEKQSEEESNGMMIRASALLALMSVMFNLA